MKKFRAFQITETDHQIIGTLKNISMKDVNEGDVTIRVTHSTINYKDALAATGKGKILRRYPLIGGIDLAGVVEESLATNFKKGDRVLVNGCGLSETRDGGYAEYAKVNKDSIILIPNNMSAYQAMQLGTAGYTAALAIHQMEQNGQTPANGPILVTGATGGVGSVAINMLSSKGYEVVALTGKTDKLEYLKNIGANQVLMRDDLDYGKRPLEKAVWGGAIDNLGGESLAWLMRTMQYGGNIACIGLAASHKLEATVMPLILRAVNLLGINSVDTPRELRMQVWERIGKDLFPKQLDIIAPNMISFDELPLAFDAFIEGTVTGRMVVKIQ
jgi:NADPH2:quinone reductase|tara:strand:+ start:6714 stop:7703 length:990 start_codon:yes stop_codon:yes gene_type:complete